MPKITVLTQDALKEAPGSPGIQRRAAFVEEGFRIVRSRVEPGTVSGWHHHGDFAVYGYMVSGEALLESGPGGREEARVNPGEFFHVPPHTIHRDSNPSDHAVEEVVLFLVGRGPMVVNEDGPEKG